MKEKDNLKKNEEKKSSMTINKKVGFYIIAIGIIIPTIILMGTMALLDFTEPVNYSSNSSNNNSKNKDDESKNNNNNNNDDLKPTEESIMNDFGFSKEDAINIVKEIYNSDNYEFEAVVTNDSKYEVTAKDPEANTKTVFIVDPGTRQYTIQ